MSRFVYHELLARKHMFNDFNMDNIMLSDESVIRLITMISKKHQLLAK